MCAVAKSGVHSTRVTDVMGASRGSEIDSSINCPSSRCNVKLIRPFRLFIGRPYCRDGDEFRWIAAFVLKAATYNFTTVRGSEGKTWELNLA